MKKHKLISNAVVVFLVAAMSVFVFTGCSSKNSSNNNNNTNDTTASGQQGQKGGANAAARKQQMQDDINALVTAGTISKDQGDKVLAALTANGAGFGGGNGQRRQANGQNTQQNNGQAPQNNQQSNGQNAPQGNNQGNGQNRQRFNPLSQLVSDGVITQAQADAVMQKIRGNFQRPQNNNQNNPQNNNQDNTQSTNQS